MHLTRATCASAIAIGVSISALTTGAGFAAAQPGPPPCGPQGNYCQVPGGPGGGGPGGGDPGGRRGGGWQPPGGPGGPGGFGGPGGGPGYRGGPGGPQWGPPRPDQAWRGIDQGRYDHQPFNYNNQWVQPIYNQDFSNWGFWFFGIWIPL